jgi:hypothetical protein
LPVPGAQEHLGTYLLEETEEGDPGGERGLGVLAWEHHQGAADLASAVLVYGEDAVKDLLLPRAELYELPRRVALG